jgi:hypothetical protein
MSDPNDDAAIRFHEDADFDEAFEAGLVDVFGHKEDEEDGDYHEE